MFRVKIAAIVAVLAFGALVAWQGPAVLAGAPPIDCQQSTVAVHLAPGAATAYRVVGWLCARGGARGKPVQLLLAGLTYDHTYWDLPYRPEIYSYVRAATEAGYATFNIDRLGVGRSDRPPAGQVTVASEGYATHDIVQALRRGAVAGTRFDTVIGVGHAFGAAIWIYEAAGFADVDGLILAGYLHQPDAARRAAELASLYPAPDDPRFAGQDLPAGYLTTRPGTRMADFSHAGYADPGLVAVDEALKQTATSGELASLDLARDPRYSRAIRVPTLLVVGARDAAGCAGAPGVSCANGAAVRDAERADYGPRACLTVQVLPGGAPDTNLYPNAHQWLAAAGGWAGWRTGTGPGRRPASACPASDRA